MLNEADKESAEINFYRDSEHESPESDSIYNIVNKMGDCAVFLTLLEKYSSVFSGAKTVIELGGGQGWASCALKKIFPHLSVTLTDISEYAVASLNKWQRIFNVSIENAYACRSFEIPEKDSSMDIVFCYSSAHHFTQMAKTLKEIYRVLTKGGTGLFLHEHSTSKLFYKQAYKRVNKIRSAVREDVLIHSEIKKIAKEIGFSVKVVFNPTLIKRGPTETIYYAFLSKFPFLQRVLPCAGDYFFVKT